LIEKGFDKNSI